MNKPNAEPTRPTLSVVEPPREATRDDRRRILDALENVYDGARGLYSGAKSDATVADELKLPRAWVSAIREQFFGPDANENDELARRKVGEFPAKLKHLEDKALALAAEAEALRAEVQSALRSLREARA